MALNDPSSTGFLVVGAGSIGSQRAAAVSASGRTRLVAVHDVVPEASKALAGRFGAEAIEVLERAMALPEVHAVIIATPHADHASQVEQALRG